MPLLLKRKSLLFLVSFASLSLFFVNNAVFAAGNNYYVATNGNDSNSGTISNPWRTINKASQTLQAGDTVFIRGGSYNEVIRPQRSGASGNYIIYKGYPGEEAIIRGNNNQGYLANLSNYSFIIIDGLTFTHGYRQPSYRGGWISVESGNSRHNIIRNNKVVTSQADQQASWDEKNSYNDKGIVIAYSQDTLIEGNYVSGMEQGIHPKRHPFRTTIRNNLVTETWQSSISVGSPGSPQFQAILIEGNILEKSITEDGIQFTQNFDLPADQQKTDISNLGTVIRNNIIRYNAENALDFKGAGNILAEGNIIYGTEGDNDGPYKCGWDCAVGGNDRGSFRTIMRGSRTSSKNIILRNNILYDNAPGIQLLDDGYRVYNNTIIGNNRDFTGPNSDWAGTDTRGFKAIGSTGATNAVVKNNIMAAHNHQEIALRIGSMGGLDINTNLYWNAAGAQFGEIVGSNTINTTFNTWKSKLQAQSNVIGDDAQSFEAKPKFVNVPSSFKPVGEHEQFDFRLAAGSPGVDVGSALTHTTSSDSGAQIYVEDAGYFIDGYGVTDGDLIVVGSNSPVRITAIDYNSNRLTVNRSINWNKNDRVNLPFSGPAPDIGAFEFGGTIIPPPATPTPTPGSTNTPVPTPVEVPGDVDGDNDVDIDDYNILIGEFGASGNSVADIDGNGKVDIFDYNLLVGNFGSIDGGVTPTITPSNNLLTNPSFEDGVEGWIKHSNGEMVFSVESGGTDGNSSAKLTINQPGSNVQLYQKDITLESDTKYFLSFDAKSNTGHDLSVHVHEHDDDYTNYGLANYVVNLSTSWQPFSTEFTTARFTSTVNDGRLRFWLAPYDEVGDEYFIDNVILRKTN